MPYLEYLKVSMSKTNLNKIAKAWLAINSFYFQIQQKDHKISKGGRIPVERDL